VPLEGESPGLDQHGGKIQHDILVILSRLCGAIQFGTKVYRGLQLITMVEFKVCLPLTCLVITRVILLHVEEEFFIHCYTTCLVSQLGVVALLCPLQMGVSHMLPAALTCLLAFRLRASHLYQIAHHCPHAYLSLFV